MAVLSEVKASIAALDAKVDAVLANQPPAPAATEADLDEVKASVDAIAAKLP